MTQNNILVIDLETGGLNAQTDAVSSITIKKLNEGITKTWHLKPYGKNYTEEAVKVNGLTKEDLFMQGIDIIRFQSELIKFLHDNFDIQPNDKKQIKLLGHNVSFDINFLKEIFPLYDEYFHYHFKDTMIIADYLRDIGLFKVVSLSLVNLYTYIFGEDKLTFHAHNSVADVMMCEKVYNDFINLKFI